MNEFLMLSETPGASKREILTYIRKMEQPALVRIVTHSGHSYTGVPVSVTDTLIFRLVDDYSRTIGLLHLEIRDIQSLIIDGDDALEVFSLGRVWGSGRYDDEAGTLEVKKILKQVADELKVSVQTFALPEDGKSLRRIVLLTDKIRETIKELLTQPDALESWEQKVSTLSFVEGTDLEVLSENNILTIHFPFSSIQLREISKKELTKQLLAVL